MNKIKSWISEHKVWAVLGGFSLIMLIFILIVLIMMFVGTSSDKYGHRLDGIEDVKISSEKKKEITDFSDDKVVSSDVRIQGKIIYIDVKFKDGTNLDDAKGIANKMLEVFSEEELKFYDVCYFLIEDKEKDGFVITGTKHPSKKEISWIKG